MIKIRYKGEFTNAASHTEVLRNLAQQEARRIVVAEGEGAFTADNSGGTPDTGRVVNAVSTAFVNEAAVSTDLASKTDAGNDTTEAMDAVRAALGELWAKTNALLTDLGLDTVTNSGGGASPDGTIGVMTTVVVGTATGVQAVEMNALRALVNTSLHGLVVKTNELCHAVGVDALVASGFGDQPIPPATQAVIDNTANGTAADPGVKKAAVDAALATWGDSVATIAARLDAVATVATSPPLVVAAP